MNDGQGGVQTVPGKESGKWTMTWYATEEDARAAFAAISVSNGNHPNKSRFREDLASNGDFDVGWSAGRDSVCALIFDLLDSLARPQMAQPQLRSPGRASRLLST
jgi:hypothetical protein